MKKAVLVILAMVIVVIFCLDAKAEVVWDVDGDGKHSLPDAIHIMQSLAGIKSPGDIDKDGDGFTPNQGDCNDNDPSIYPGAPEICGDGIDQDCSGADLPCLPPGCYVLLDSSSGTLTIYNIAKHIRNYVGGNVVKVLSDKLGWDKDDGLTISVLDGNISIKISDIAFSDGVTRFGVIAIHADESINFMDSFVWCDDDQKLIVITDESCPYGAGDPAMAVYLDPDTGGYIYVPDGIVVTCRDKDGVPITQ